MQLTDDYLTQMFGHFVATRSAEATNTVHRLLQDGTLAQVEWFR